jgi:predicted PurR-regulated permease PerM
MDPFADKVGADALESAPDLAPEPAPSRLEIDIAPAAIVKGVTTVLVLWLVARLFNVIVIVGVSLMLVATFSPMVRRLQSHYTRRGALSLVIVGIICLIALPLGLVFPILVSQGTSLVTHLPSYAESLQRILAHHGVRTNLQRGVQDLITSVSQGIPQIMGVLGTILHVGVEVFTVLVLTIYLLIEGPEVAQGALRLLPRERRLGVRRLCADIGLQVGAYVRGQLILSICAGSYFFALLLVLGVPDALVLALVAALADAIPFAGLLIALVPACLSALSISSMQAGLVALFYLLYHQLEANFIAPRVFGSTLGLSVSIVVIAIIVGVELLGVVGAMLALPVAAALPIVIRYAQALHEELTAVEQPA